MKNSNNLINEKSPYLLQHAHDPVNWFPWCEEAFKKAKNENKPILLSIGYSTCHWCHVMARESFEDNEVANILNKYFINIKVDKEERPDIDTIYMNVCQILTGSGGWPLTIFLTPHQKPFFAGTYFSKYSKFGVPGFIDILIKIKEIWAENHNTVSESAEKIINFVNSASNKNNIFQSTPEKLIDITVASLKNTFDSIYGGFGDAPKFPSPHNLLFLLKYYEVNKDASLLKMVEKTLTQMYKGGIFDHIGFGFSRYSIDRKWLVPHFEKMLYDNALLTTTYLEAYKITHNELFKKVAEKVMKYVLRELMNPDGGFYSAQDADSNGVEGKYYVFTPNEIIKIIGKDGGEKFNKYFDITQKGNFQGKSIPNLIKNNNIDNSMDPYLSKIYEYRVKRNFLHKDDKILTSWNSLMTSAFLAAYSVLKKEKYLKVAEKNIDFILENLCDNDKIFTSFRDGKRSHIGFLDDYAFYIHSLINIYQVTLEKTHLNRAVKLLGKAVEDFFDFQNGGFYFTSKHDEKLISRPKETYDSAIPSGNSVMVYNLLFISKIIKNSNFEQILQKQIDFMSKESENYPSGHCFFNLCMLIILHPIKEIVCVLKNSEELPKIKEQLPKNSIITILEKENENYKLLNNQTTYYICENNRCLPPVNKI